MGKALPKGLNSSFIALIPKVKQPKLIKEFRPISLINCTLKIVTKVLANCLKRVLNSIIAENQPTYIRVDKFRMAS